MRDKTGFWKLIQRKIEKKNNVYIYNEKSIEIICLN